MNIKIMALIAYIVMVGVTSCKKLIEIDLPIDQNTKESTFADANLASSVIEGIYSNMRSSFITGESSLAISTGLAGDELSSGPREYNLSTYQNEYVIFDPTGVWDQSYGQYVFSINSAIEGIFSSNGIPEGTKKVLLAEAKFLRAFIYFNLVNTYGDVPLVLTSDFKTNSTIARTSKALVYEQIIKDLLDAQSDLKDEYLQHDLETVNPTGRLRANKAAATALLSRVYLYVEQWDKAAEEAGKVIGKSDYYELLPLNMVFLKDSREAIWQLQPDPNNTESANTRDGRFFIPAPNDVPWVILSSQLLSVFESGDARRTNWITEVIDGGGDTYTIPYKYKLREGSNQEEYLMILRLSEQYLIRAEARIHTGNIEGGIEDLNVLRARASNPLPDILPPLSLTMQLTEALDAVAKERQRELFTECGHRWFDLKRTNKIDDVMSEVTPQKGGTWSPYKALFPIPLNDFRLNPSLRGHQNPGYPES